ncbi:hypothetical protein SAMN02745945_01742 [Peptoclostridium litorale DSM 5388]|uniref:Uncharacterized protein n=1 Tax=Peptoclostridium litorale DSM 5388 TaxID=1121324 RepID=A0A069RG39_PEPLI|nr:hypothetical protein CLIT_8c01550 [Peptoclostridium litorale DSM 5388]SIO08650.1 hypothetical protein SAMN02745945_01742 [Peptoclostridium litorale DSM 5388]
MSENNSYSKKTISNREDKALKRKVEVKKPPQNSNPPKNN